MKVIAKGQVVEVGASEFDGKKYPFFMLLTDGARGKELIRVSGNGKKVGDTFEGPVNVYADDKGKMRVKAL